MRPPAKRRKNDLSPVFRPAALPCFNEAACKEAEKRPVITDGADATFAALQ